MLTKVPCTTTANIKSTDELLQSTRQPSSTNEPKSRPVEESAGKQSFHPSHFVLLIGEGSPRPPRTAPLIWWDRVNNLFKVQHNRVCGMWRRDSSEPWPIKTYQHAKWEITSHSTQRESRNQIREVKRNNKLLIRYRFVSVDFWPLELALFQLYLEGEIVLVMADFWKWCAAISRLLCSNLESLPLNVICN